MNQRSVRAPSGTIASLFIIMAVLFTLTVTDATRMSQAAAQAPNPPVGAWGDQGYERHNVPHPRVVISATDEGHHVGGREHSDRSGGSGAEVPTQTVDCGLRRGGEMAGIVGDIGCRNAQANCTTGAAKPDPRDHVVVTIQLGPGGSQTLLGENCTARAGKPAAAAARPVLTVTAIRQQVARLIPPVTVGAAGPRGQALVNAEKLLWVNTDPQRPLGTVTVVGIPVALRITLRTVNWDFGDQTTDVTAEPGKPYDADNDPCGTKECPDYYGHTYLASAPVIIGATVRWTAQYSVRGGPWQTIPDDIPGPLGRTAVQVLEAHAVLVR